MDGRRNVLWRLPSARFNNCAMDAEAVVICIATNGMRVEAVRREGFVLGALLQPAVWVRRRISPAPLLQSSGLKSVERREQKQAMN